MVDITVTQSETSCGAGNNNNCSHAQPFSLGSDRFIAFRSLKVIRRKLSYSYLLTSLYQSLHTICRAHSSYVTVISLGGQAHVTQLWLTQVLEYYHSTDDVFRFEFLNGIIFTGVKSGEVLDISPGAKEMLVSLGNSWVETVDADDEEKTPPPGPYLVAGRHLLEIYRLYDDIQGAFMNGLVTLPHL